jgi:hypothetical protein
VAGELIIVCFSYNNSAQAASCSDNAAGGTNTYNEVGSSQTCDTGINISTGHMFYAIAKATETITITVTNETDAGIHAHVASGNNTTLAAVLDAFSKGVDSSATTAHTSTDIVTTNPDDYIIGFWFEENTGSTLVENGTGFTNRTSQGSHVSFTFDRIVSSTGTYNEAVTSGWNGIFGHIIASFKAADGEPKSNAPYHRRKLFIRRAF